MNKFILIVAIIIVLFGAWYIYSSILPGTNNILSQSIIPTSTSAPTPTSIYKTSIREIPSIAADTVTLTANGFSPQVLTIKHGQTATWVNNSGTQATINSDPHPTH